MTIHDRIEFGIIRFVHETLFGIFVNPYSRLSTAGVQTGQKVLEVGCGPGFFTIPAAKIVGKEGFVYSLDLNPFAVEHVKRKIDNQGLANVEVMHADAAKISLPSDSVDIAFLFSVIHAFPDAGEVIKEMHRVLKANGMMCIQSGWPEEKLVNLVTADGIFRLQEKSGRLYNFRKTSA